MARPLTPCPGLPSRSSAAQSESDRRLIMKIRFLAGFAVFAAAGALAFWGQTGRPEFKPAPEVPAMPKALMKFPRTEISRAKFPAVDFHLHGRSLKTAADYQKMIRLMDQTGIAVICNMDSGYGKVFNE